ncbi:hypothetical protein TRFO_04368 [Tritrichomonas foetus]|uniref:EF-hand domain-containing protein n=1 Tax=Tritrichomonas foetus TaxID=1144522 RepID=A0A1J4KEI9_9EUKA|nr:hypothetical protein TRFO_04368 [Tritrichomonas foetus]|eukprot:OHT09849.1 hypothetical protein TRFO_04368 [Tritrichomonas foetus]
MSLLASTAKLQAFLDTDKEIKQEYNQLLRSSHIDDKIPPFLFNSDPDNKNVQNIVMNIIKISRKRSMTTIFKKYPKSYDIKLLRKEFLKLNPKEIPRFLKYSDYRVLQSKWETKFPGILTAQLFLKLCKSIRKTINPDDLFFHLTIQATILRYYQIIFFKTPMRNNAITKLELGRVVEEITKDYDFLNDIEVKFPEEGKPYYIAFVVELFFCELDPLHTGFILIDDFLTSDLFMYLVKLETIGDNPSNLFGSGGFYLYYDHFTSMNYDDSGILTKDDLLYMKGTRFTSSFIDRIFDSCNVLDFSWFCRFKHSYNKLGRPWANFFFFDILDIDKNGEINDTEINHFYHDLSKDFESFMNEKPLSFHEFTIQLIDQCNMQNSSMTKEEFVNSKLVNIFVRSLVDLKAFVKMENGREIPSRGEEEEEEESNSHDEYYDNEVFVGTDSINY